MRRMLLTVVISGMMSWSMPPEAPGCGAAPRRGELIGVNGEEAIILYDAKTKTEHFIRRADFRTQAKDFGFLVPTPSRPELGETQSHIFDQLHTATLPRRVESGNVKRIVRRRDLTKDAPRAGAPAPAAPVVLDRKKVAGFDAVVLRADDLDGLKKWLEDHQYDARPALMEWLKWYVENKWIITAFKIISDPMAQHDRWAKAVRMSFATDTPFYPYREPEDMRKNVPPAARKLRVFYLGDARMEGTLGKADAWPGRAVWANSMPGHLMTSVINGLGMTATQIDQLKSNKWYLTEFEDLSSPRPGTDELYFKKASDQSELERPVIYYDRYEYVDEDTDKGTEHATENTPVLGEAFPTRWFVLGVVAAISLFVLGVAAYFLLRKSIGG